MKNNLLIPNRYKVFGWIIFLIFAVLGIATESYQFTIPALNFEFGAKSDIFKDNDFTNELAVFGIIIGLLMISFAREPKEDEYISLIRLKSWQWSVLISYIILIFINFTCYGMGFLVILAYNMFTVLLVFIAKFNYSLYKLNREVGNEK